MHEYEHHELSKFFPMLPPEEFEQLKASISEHGLREPIVLLDGKILDGRNRYKACLEADVEPRFEEYEGGNSEALDFVVDMNMRRRHLTEGQKAQIIMDIEGRPEPDYGGKRGQTSPPRREGSASYMDLAKKAGVSADTVKRVSEVQDRPKLQEQLREGQITPRAAARERTKEVQRKAEIAPTWKSLYAKAPRADLINNILGQVINGVDRWLTNEYGLSKIDAEAHTPLLINKTEKAITALEKFKAALEDLRNG